MKTYIKRAIVAAVFTAAAAAAGAAEFWTYVPGNGQLSVNTPGGGAGFAPVTVTGYSGSGGQFNGNFWDAGAKPADSFFRFFCNVCFCEDNNRLPTALPRGGQITLQPL